MSTTSNSAKKPVIGITTWRRRLPTFLGEETDLYTLDPEYASCVEQAGGLPILLPHSLDNAEAYLNMLDGLIVSGGDDVDPSMYGEENLGQSYAVNKEVDQFEVTLIQQAKAIGIPTLGICKGFQLLNIAFGGKLLQDLHEEYPKHPRTEGNPEHILGQRHLIKFTENCLLSHIYGSSKRMVNTIHHQSVRSLGEGFIAVGLSEDGLIEAVESEMEWFALGVQWHPEKMGDTWEPKLFQYFIQYIQHLRKEEV